VFEKWEVVFFRSINPPARRIGARDIITMIDYLTRWAEAGLVIYFSVETTTWLLFEKVVTRFEVS
jgi:hypothetical protein